MNIFIKSEVEGQSSSMTPYNIKMPDLYIFNNNIKLSIYCPQHNQTIPFSANTKLYKIKTQLGQELWRNYLSLFSILILISNLKSAEKYCVL